MTTEYRRTYCGLCHPRCGLRLEIENGRAVKVTGDPEDPITRGRICNRGKLMLDHVYHPDRLNSRLNGKASGGAVSGNRSHGTMHWMRSLTSSLLFGIDMARRRWHSLTAPNGRITGISEDSIICLVRPTRAVPTTSACVRARPWNTPPTAALPMAIS